MEMMELYLHLGNCWVIYMGKNTISRDGYDDEDVDDGGDNDDNDDDDMFLRKYSIWDSILLDEYQAKVEFAIGKYLLCLLSTDFRMIRWLFIRNNAFFHDFLLFLLFLSS